jgi:hypothetical protein
MPKRIDPYDIVGKEINGTFVKDFIEKKNRQVYYNCICFVCGKEYRKPRTLLFRKKSSCRGCSSHRKPHEDFTNRKFGKVLVLEYVGDSKWKCKCDCGTEFTTVTHSLKSGQTKTCGCSRFLNGKSHHNWKGYKDIPQKVWSDFRRGAEKRNLEFNVSIEYGWELYLYQNKKCALTGYDISFGTTRRSKDQTASLDRIDSSKGYIEGNIQWLHKDINILKWDWTTDQLLKFCEDIINWRMENNGEI